MNGRRDAFETASIGEPEQARGTLHAQGAEQPAAPEAPGDEVPPGSPGAGENVCPACGGKGVVGNETCSECQGTGKVVTGIGGG